MLKEAHVGTDSASLLAFLRERTPPDADLQSPDLLIRQFGSEKFQEREDATTRAIALGPRILPTLRQALSHHDPEIVSRARSCIEQIEHGMDMALPQAVARLLAKRHPAGALEALLGYLGAVPSDKVAEEVSFAIDALAARDARTTPALLAALKDPLASRRAVAACIVGAYGDASQRELVQKCLKDQEPMGRLRAAQGLLAGRDERGIPVLVALLAEPSIELGWQAEELLHCVAGDDAPQATIGPGSVDSRQKCRHEWEAWASKRLPSLDWPRIIEDCRRPALLLVVDQKRPPAENNGRIWLCGCDGRPRWEIQNSGYSFSNVQFLWQGRILLVESRRAPTILEQMKSREWGPITLQQLVVERDHIVWRHTKFWYTHQAARLSPKYPRYLGQPSGRNCRPHAAHEYRLAR
jgi:hypothetical protein